MIRSLWPLMLGAFALGLDAFVLAGLLPGMALGLRTSQALVGLGVAIFTAAYAISAPLLASAAGGRSTRKALLVGLGLFTLGNMATSVAPSLAVLLAARLVAGIGAGFYSPLAAASAANMVPVGQRGQALGLVLAGLSMGSAFGVPVGLLVEDYCGWRWTIGLIVVLGLLAMFGVAGRSAGFATMPVVSWRERLLVLTDRFTFGTLGVSLCTGIASLGLYTYLAALIAGRHMAGFMHGFIWLWGLGGMVGALLVGRVIDRYLPPVRATACILVLLGLSFSLVGWGAFIGVCIGCFLWGLAGWGSVTPQQHALVTQNGRQATAAIAWNSSANYLGSAIGAALGSLALSQSLPVGWLPLGALAWVVIGLVIHINKPLAQNGQVHLS